MGPLTSPHDCDSCLHKSQIIAKLEQCISNLYWIWNEEDRLDSVVTIGVIGITCPPANPADLDSTIPEPGTGSSPQVVVNSASSALADQPVPAPQPHQLAPINTKTVSFIHSAPWYTPELHTMKSRKRPPERLYKKTSLTVHLQAYTDHLLHYKNTLNTARSNYYSHLIHSGSNNPKTLFSTTNFSNLSTTPPHSSQSTSATHSCHSTKQKLTSSTAT
ncbi:hypothetical protein ABVT39_027627 [Epinephelus coioides]